MIIHTKGIVLNYVKFSESAIIVRVFTEKSGLRSYLIKGVRSSKSRQNKMAFYQHLNQLEMVTYEKENRELHKINEVKIDYTYQQISFHPMKNLIAMFLTEVLVKVLRGETDENEELYHFLEHSLRFLDQVDEHYANFHLQFLLKLPEYLGLAIEDHKQLVSLTVDYSDANLPLHQVIDELLAATYLDHIPLNKEWRRYILDAIVTFYQYHFEHFGELKSLEVLREIQ